MAEEKQKKKDVCPKCGASLGPIEETKTGRKLQRCSKGSWNAETRKVEGCPFVKWIQPEPEILDEKCPKCGAPVRGDEVKWTGQQSADCSYCGANLPMH